MKLFQNLWMFSVVIFLFVNFRVRGANQWSPSSAAVADAQASAANQSDGLSSSLPKNKPEAFRKAFFVVSGWKISGKEGDDDTLSGSEKEGEVDSTFRGDQGEYELRMTSSLKNNPKSLKLATEPWCVSPGTFVVEETTEVTADEGEEKRTVVEVRSIKQFVDGGGDGERGGPEGMASSSGETKQTTLEIDI